jgi:hypothetical protein
VTNTSTAMSLRNIVSQFFIFWSAVSEPKRQGLHRMYPRSLISLIVDDFFKQIIGSEKCVADS